MRFVRKQAQKVFLVICLHDGPRAIGVRGHLLGCKVVVLGYKGDLRLQISARELTPVRLMRNKWNEFPQIAVDQTLELR